MKTNTYFLSDLGQFLLKWEIFQTKVVEKKHNLCPITFFFFENRAVYEITWENIVEPNRPQMTIRRMRIVCWVSKVTNTHSEYVRLIACPQQQWLHERASLLRYSTLPVKFLAKDPNDYQWAVIWSVWTLNETLQRHWETEKADVSDLQWRGSRGHDRKIWPRPLPSASSSFCRVPSSSLWSFRCLYMHSELLATSLK